MKTFVMIVGSIVLGIIALATLGPLVALALNGIIAYHSYKKFNETSDTLSKVFWGLLGIVTATSAFSIALGSLPFIIGILAAALLVKLYVDHQGNKKKHRQTETFEANYSEIL